MIVIRHARSVVDASVPPEDWELAPDAPAAAAELGQHLRAKTIIASDERKAIDTAVALGIGLIGTYAAFREVTRPWYGDAAGLAQAAARWFAGEGVDGWEPFADAVARFGRGIEMLDPDGLIVVTHGTVMTAWLTSVGAIEDAFAFWSDLRMPDAWQVADGVAQRYPAA